MRRAAFTMAELLVAMALMGLISIALVNLYSMSVNTLRQGSGHLAMQQRVREAVRRVHPLLSTAIPPNASQEAIYAPPAGPAAPAVTWSTTEDLLGNTPVDPRAPSFRLYQLAFNAATSELVLSQLGPLPAPPARVVARNLNQVSFEHISLNTVRMVVQAQEQIRRAAGETTPSTYRSDTLLQIPYYTSQ
ncbi:hypothetical protein DYH09_30390 [bacterium CPR1]|nr:hypothetical protein [bacterium CPR1]